MREGWFRITGWNLHGTCAAADAEASARCRRSGLRATVRVERQDVIDAILSQHGEQLSSFGSNRLADRQPHLSARSLSSTRRRCAIAAMANLLVALAVFWPAMAKAAALVAFPVLFLAVSALKLASAVATPRVTMPARALVPRPIPSAAPAAMAMTFLMAPPISTPTTSMLV